MSDWDFDLLGDPIPDGFGRRGRPQHIPTADNRRKIVALAAFGMGAEQIASAIGITPPTLRKHYFRELRTLADAKLRLQGKAISKLLAEVDKGNVSAIALLFKRIDKHDMTLLAERTATRGGTASPREKLGKKAQMKEAAGKVAGKFAPPAGPTLIN